MQCHDVQCKLGLYLDRELPSSERTEVELHCACCSDCQAELAELKELADGIANLPSPSAPPILWSSIAQRLDRQSTCNDQRTIVRTAGWHRQTTATRRKNASWRGPLSLAAMFVFALGLGWLALSQWDTQASASTVNFGVLLDHLSFDPRGAFDKFVQLYEGKPATREVARRHAAKLNFEIPNHLPGGFVLDSVYILKFGRDPGVAVSYSRTGEPPVGGGEFLAAIFHPAVKQEDFGTRKDLPCVVGEHRGHKVEAGDWKLVHLTDPTTCHCVLSRLDEATELPAIMAAVAPDAKAMVDHAHSHHDRGP